jgi:hypothetical protein
MLFCNKLVVFSSLNAVLYVLRAVPEISYTQSCAGVFGDGSGCGGGRVAVHHQMRPVCPKYPNHPIHPSFLLCSRTNDNTPLNIIKRTPKGCPVQFTPELCSGVTTNCLRQFEKCLRATLPINQLYQAPIKDGRPDSNVHRCKARRHPLSSHTPQFHTVRIWRPASWFDRTPTRTNLLAILGYTVTRTDDDDGPRVHVEYLSVCNDQEIIEPTEAVELRQSLVAHLSQTDVGKITMLM